MHRAAAHADLAAIAQQHPQALREVADRLGITVKVIDTPAEEQVGGKALLRRHLEAKQMIHGIVSQGTAARPTSRPPGPPRRTTCPADVESLLLLEGWVLTGIHPQIAIDSGGALSNQPEFTSACITVSARRAATGGAA